jgi:hypothetical protein
MQSPDCMQIPARLRRTKERQARAFTAIRPFTITSIKHIRPQEKPEDAGAFESFVFRPVSLAHTLLLSK